MKIRLTDGDKLKRKRESSNRSYIKNKDKKAAYSKKRREENPELYREIGKKYYVENKDKIAITQSIYRKENKDKIIEYAFNTKEERSIYRKETRHLSNARTTRRRASKLNASIELTSELKEQIKYFYIEASRLTIVTGIQHQVDHIIPLQNNLVCGFHVPWNLQILTAEENHKKNNKLVL